MLMSVKIRRYRAIIIIIIIIHTLPANCIALVGGPRGGGLPTKKHLMVRLLHRFHDKSPDRKVNCRSLDRSAVVFCQEY